MYKTRRHDMPIIINKPYVEKIDGGKVRLCSNISGSTEGVLYYEVDERYGEYLCDDCGDAFLLGLINLAMYENLDILCKTDITSDLLFQLRTYYIPILAKNNMDFHLISIQANEATTPLKSANAVVTGNSGGVDSFYTILKYSADEFGSNKITHLLFNNISTADKDDSRIRALFNRDSAEKSKIANELNLEFVAMYSNLYSFYKRPGLFNMYYAAQYASAAHALAKLFGTFYFSSAYPIEDFSLDTKSVINKIYDSACYDLFSLECLSTRSLRIYSSGMEVNRNEKVMFICEHPLTQHHLQVCSIEQDAGNEFSFEKMNCGSCHKCRRTILQLYSIGKEAYFSDIFDLSEFYKNKGKYIGKGLAGDLFAFSKNIKTALKKSGKMPKNEWYWEFLYRTRYFISKNKALVKIYHRIRNKR